MRKRITSKGSKTAQWTCLVRAISFQEARPLFKCDDWLASKMLTGFLRVMSKPLLSSIAKLFIPLGSYQQVIARTKYFDEALKLYSADADQVLLFGAGFDSRLIRFNKALINSKVFELDAPYTQRNKIKLLKKHKVALPSNLIFVSVDFEKDSLTDRLIEAGFRNGCSTVFVLEGLSMYLNAESIDGTFRAIENLAGKGSTLIVDFIEASVLYEQSSRKRKGDLFFAAMAGEPYVFGLHENEIKEFLIRYSFEPIDISNSQDLEVRFFTDDKGNKVSGIRGKHSTMVTARKR